jgi:hypothetical protein
LLGWAHGALPLRWRRLHILLTTLLQHLGMLSF